MKKYPNISRMLAILLVLALLVPCISMTAFSQDIPCVEDGCSGKYLNGICTVDAAHFEAAPAEGGVYRISNAGQLYWFAALVNSGDNDSDAVLTADITINADMTAEEKLAWIPIGLYTSARENVRYAGTFDGAGYTIYGLYYDNTNYDGRNAGLFGTVDTDGTVKNLTLADSVINGATEIGGIASYNYGTILGCTQSGTVTGTGATGGIVCRNMGVVDSCVNTGAVTGATTGGIAAENNGEVMSCDNTGAVSGTNSVGGIVGMNDGTVDSTLNTATVTASGTHAGGVIGNLVGGELIGSGNTGTVTGASDYIGGVAGACTGANITECFNEGAVNGSTGASDAIGGVVGAIDGTNTTKSVITNCYNTGSINGRSWVGGIAGLSGYQKTPQAVEFVGGYNTGAVIGTSYVGTVAGNLTKGTVSGMYYLLGGQNSVSGATSATADQFASGEIAYQLNGSTDQGELIWKQTIGTDASPRFEGAVVYFDSANGTYYNMGCAHSAGEAVRENEVAADCTTAGSYDSVVYCTICGEELSRNTVTVPALGHDFVDGECTRCDEVVEQPGENPFKDVTEGSYYYDAVLWATENGIVFGLDPTHFGPNAGCTRAQAVTFLWRAAGRPEPKTNVNPFTDVKADSYYYDAVLWAVENGIVYGISNTSFAPNQTCTRGHIVSFLYRFKGRPEVHEDANTFTDLESGAYYYDAVLWAVENGITSGVGNNRFAPDQTCTRAQIVSFLYRASTN